MESDNNKIDTQQEYRRNDFYQRAIEHYYAREVEQDYTSAVLWFREAANLGHLKAQGFLGWMNKKGEGLTQNYEKASLELDQIANDKND